MALVNCSECSTEVSAAAVSCPKCGHPLLQSKPKSKSKNQATLAILLGIGSCWLWFGAQAIFIFPYDSAIFGAILLLYGVIQFAKKS